MFVLPSEVQYLKKESSCHFSTFSFLTIFLGIQAAVHLLWNSGLCILRVA